jgi:hypothetical protein
MCRYEAADGSRNAQGAELDEVPRVFVEAKEINICEITFDCFRDFILVDQVEDKA